MTPSGWHDDARNRDAGHDEMQIAVFDYLRSKVANPRVIEDLTYIRQNVHFEYPLVRDGAILAWADIATVWQAKNDNPPSALFIEIFEVKPKIYSVGAVVRQCEALAMTAVKCGRKDRHSGYRQAITVSVTPVVCVADPKLNALKHVYCSAVWDGERLA